MSENYFEGSVDGFVSSKFYENSFKLEEDICPRNNDMEDVSSGSVTSDASQLDSNCYLLEIEGAICFDTIDDLDNIATVTVCHKSNFQLYLARFLFSNYLKSISSY